MTAPFLGLDLEIVYSLRWPMLGFGVVALFLIHRHLGSSTATFRQLLGEVAILIPAYFAYYTVRGFAQGRESQAFGTAIDIIELEQTMGIFWEPALQGKILEFDLLVNFVNWTYIWGFWPVIVFVGAWLFLLHREQYGLYRNAFLISGGIGLVIFWMLPVAPPRFMDAWGFVDTITERSQDYRVMQPPAFVNQYAAMPSLHFGYNLLVGIALVRHSSSPIIKALGVALPVLMFASIVLTANHYIIDGLAGGTLALIGLGGAMFLQRIMEQSGPTAESAPPLVHAT